MVGLGERIRGLPRNRGILLPMGTVAFLIGLGEATAAQTGHSYQELQEAFPSGYTQEYLIRAHVKTSTFETEVRTAVQAGNVMVGANEIIIFTPRETEDAETLRRAYQALADERERQTKIFEYRKQRVQEEAEVDLKNPKNNRGTRAMGLMVLGALFLLRGFLTPRRKH